MKRTNDNCNKCDRKNCNSDVVRGPKGEVRGYRRCLGWIPIISKFKHTELVSKVTAGTFPTSPETAKLFHKYM